MPSDAVAHILRPKPPWSAVDLTVCGRAAGDVAKLATIPEVAAYAKKHGKKRTYFDYCVTCVERTYQWTWIDHPMDILREYVDAGRYGRSPGRREAAERIEREVHALAVLVERHREEFESLAATHDDVPDLTTRRRATRQQRNHP